MNVASHRLGGWRLGLHRVRQGFKVLFNRGPAALVEAIRSMTRPAAMPQADGTAPAPRPPMHVWHLDSPNVIAVPANPEAFELNGWIASDSINYIRFEDRAQAKLLPLAISPRPDVTAVYGLPAQGFTATCAYEAIRHLDHVVLAFGTREGRFEIIVPTWRAPQDRAALKRAKIGRLEAQLRCPNCGATDLGKGESSLRCQGCGTAFGRTDTQLDFLTPELRAAFGIVDTTNVSSNGYDGEALNIIHRLREGLILDCGAGLRDRYFPNVVNYEIVAYDTTDVLGVGERLPFRDSTFDAVFSFAVLEHVKDPFACGRELLRVLKPGGTLYCQVPFLQPVHGYPHHYYNMTLTGMLNLFGDAIHVERAGSFQFGQPVFALSWILNRYVAGLPAELRPQFMSMRVEELLAPPDRSLGAPHVAGLSEAVREELSCCNSVIATKVPRQSTT